MVENAPKGTVAFDHETERGFGGAKQLRGGGIAQDEIDGQGNVEPIEVAQEHAREGLFVGKA